MAQHVTVLEDGSVQITYDPPEENPSFGEQGWSVPLSEAAAPEQVERVLEGLHADAGKTLPTGTVYQLRTTVRGSKKPGVAWYHVMRMKDWPVTGAIRWPGEMNPLGGYRCLGTFRTP